MAVTASDEPVEVLDDQGAVVDVVPRSVMRSGNLRHRAVYVVVCSGTRVLVHQRADWKDVWPARWDLAFGGVCGVGERFTEAARRELAEEAGIDVGEHELLDLGDGRYEADDVRVLGRAYAVAHDGPFTFSDGEVQAVEWVERADLRTFVTDHEVCADTVEIVLGRLLR